MQPVKPYYCSSGIEGSRLVYGNIYRDQVFVDGGRFGQRSSSGVLFPR